MTTLLEVVRLAATGTALAIGFALVKYLSDVAGSLELLAELKRREQAGLEAELANLNREAKT